jgi:hypothetical protein
MHKLDPIKRDFLDDPERLFSENPDLSAYAEDHGLWPWMNAKKITLRSLVRRRVCFGGFRRRTWRYHGLCPWGSIEKCGLHLIPGHPE